MELEILLESSGHDPEEQKMIEKRLRDWHGEGAEIRYNKECFGQLAVIEYPGRYRVDIGRVDPINAIRDLHARLYRFGVKVFIHFLP